jgi:hypothetical protein
MKFFSSILLIIASIFLGCPGQAAGEDKNQYSLFNPTPKEKMRELSTDRPDKTESPYTVDAGHFQLEADLYIATRDEESYGGITEKSSDSSFFVTNFKIGLTNSMDLQIIAAPVNNTESSRAGERTIKKSGFGDTLLRLKWNFLGNDDGALSLGLMPFVKLATNTNGLGNNEIEGGLLVPGLLNLPDDWSLGFMLQFNRMKNEDKAGFRTDLISTITLGHDIVGDLAAYGEFFSQSTQQSGVPWIATFDFGFTYGLTEDIQLDLGGNFGLTAAADDLQTFLGISARY